MIIEIQLIIVTTVMSLGAFDGIISIFRINYIIENIWCDWIADIGNFDIRT